MIFGPFGAGRSGAARIEFLDEKGKVVDTFVFSNLIVVRVERYMDRPGGGTFGGRRAEYATGLMRTRIEMEAFGGETGEGITKVEDEQKDSTLNLSDTGRKITL